MFGTSVFDFVPEDELEETRERLLTRRDGVSDHAERRLVRVDGREVWVHLSSTGLAGEDGNVTGALAMVSDITERRTNERELERWQRRGGARQARRRCGARMNNLLGVILNFSDFGLGEVGEGAGKEELTEIRQAAERAATLTRQLLVFARHDVVRAESFDLNSLLDELGKLLRRTIGEHIALTSHDLRSFRPSAPTQVWWSRWS